MANETLGRIKCPLAGDLAEVRQDKRGKFYYVGEAGMIKPNLPAGQEWLKRNAEFFTEEQKKSVNEKPLDFGRRFKETAEFQAPKKEQEKEGGFWPFD